MSTEDLDGALLLKCKGRLTHAVSELFKTTVKGYFPESKQVILDLGNVVQMDSSGLGAIVQLYVSAKSSNCQLQLYNLSAPVKRLFGLTKVLTAFESCGSYLTRLP